ncbi:MAG: carbon monoxide dehydrogenase subunit G [Acidobacteriota bacterium]|nr:carbon monoxide dehydrogenase subunit G [Acidobacteriota bacterium]
MKIQGDHLFNAPRQAVWEAVLDPKVLSSSLPGFERLDEVGENRYEGALNIRVGPVQGKFQGTLELSDLDPLSGYVFKMSGKGAAGFVEGLGTLQLTEETARTRLVYDVDAKVGGRIAGVGQRLLDSSAKVLTRQALEGLDQHLAQEAAPADASAAGATVVPSAPKPPSQAVFAAKFAKELAGELVPPERRPLVFSIALVLYTLAVVLITRACS